ncbi:MAG: hypothetical protein FWE53_00480 [Firmicutes bacterium]|nr:hypothetical protein [Bacillota bacterium]
MSYSYGQKSGKKRTWIYIVSAVAVVLAAAIVTLVITLRPGNVPEPEYKLSAPSNLVVVVENGRHLVKFGAVTNAKSYDLLIDESRVTIYGSDLPLVEFDITNWMTDYKQYAISVKARAANSEFDSDYTTNIPHNNTTRLASPQLEVDLTGSVLMWNSVPRADMYKVTIDTVDFLTSRLVFDIAANLPAIAHLGIGSYDMKVAAHNSNSAFVLDSLPSNILKYVINTELSAPANLRIDDMGGSLIVSWSPVSGASCYELELLHGGTSTELGYTNDLAFDITSLVSNPLEYAVRVRAIGAPFVATSPFTEPVVYQKFVTHAAPAGLAAVKEGNQLIITWDAVPGALSYNLVVGTDLGFPFVSGDSISITATRAVVPLSSSDDGIYNIKVRVNAGPAFYNASEFCEPIRVDVNTQLDTPVGLAVGGAAGAEFLTWQHIPYATNGYLVRAYSGGSVVASATVKDNWAALGSLVSVSGEYRLTVQAIGYKFYAASAESASLLYVIKYVLPAPVLFKVEVKEVEAEEETDTSSEEEVINYREYLVWTKVGQPASQIYYSIWFSGLGVSGWVTDIDGKRVNIRQDSESFMRTDPVLGLVEVFIYDITDFLDAGNLPYVFRVKAFPEPGNNVELESVFSNEQAYGPITPFGTPDNVGVDSAFVLTWERVPGTRNGYYVMLNGKLINSDEGTTTHFVNSFNLINHLRPGENTVSVCAAGYGRFLQSPFSAPITVNYTVIKLAAVTDFNVSARIVGGTIRYQANFNSVRHATHYIIVVEDDEGNSIIVKRPVPLGLSLLISIEIPEDLIEKSGTTMFSIVAAYLHEHALPGSEDYTGWIINSNKFEYYYHDLAVLATPVPVISEDAFGRWWVSWGAIDRATGYAFSVSVQNAVSTPISLTLSGGTTAYELTDYFAANGGAKYQIVVRAIGNNLLIANSAAAMLIYDRKLQLATPDISVEVRNGRHEVVWEVVPYATVYNVRVYKDYAINGTSVTVVNQNTSFLGSPDNKVRLDIEPQLSAAFPGIYTVVVTAIGHKQIPDEAIGEYYYQASLEAELLYTYSPPLSSPNFRTVTSGETITVEIIAVQNAVSYEVYASRTGWNAGQLSLAELVESGTSLSYNISGWFYPSSTAFFGSPGEVYFGVRAIASPTIPSGSTVWYQDSLCPSSQIYVHYGKLDMVSNVEIIQLFNHPQSTDDYGIVFVSWQAPANSLDFEIKVTGSAAIDVPSNMITDLGGGRFGAYLNSGYFSKIPQQNSYTIEIRASDNLAAFYLASNWNRHDFTYCLQFETANVSFVGGSKVLEATQSLLEIVFERPNLAARSFAIHVTDRLNNIVLTPITFTPSAGLNPISYSLTNFSEITTKAGVYEVRVEVLGSGVWANSPLSTPVYCIRHEKLAATQDLFIVKVESAAELRFTPVANSETYTLEFFREDWPLETIVITRGECVPSGSRLVYSIPTNLVDVATSYKYTVKLYSNDVTASVTIPSEFTGILPNGYTYLAYLKSDAAETNYEADGALSPPAYLELVVIEGVRYLTWTQVWTQVTYPSSGLPVDSYRLAYVLRDANGIYFMPDGTVVPWEEDTYFDESVGDWVTRYYQRHNDYLLAELSAVLTSANVIVGQNGVYVDDGRVYYPLTDTLTTANLHLTYYYAIALLAEGNNEHGNSDVVLATLLPAPRDAPEIVLADPALSPDFYINKTGGTITLSFKNELSSQLGLYTEDGKPRWENIYSLSINGKEQWAINDDNASFNAVTSIITIDSVWLAEKLRGEYELVKDHHNFNRYFSIKLYAHAVNGVILTEVKEDPAPNYDIPNGSFEQIIYGNAVMYEERIIELNWLAPYLYDEPIIITSVEDDASNNYVINFSGDLRHATGFVIEVCDINGDPNSPATVLTIKIGTPGQSSYSLDFTSVLAGLSPMEYTVRLYVYSDTCKRVYGQRSSSDQPYYKSFRRYALENTVDVFSISGGLSNILSFDAPAGYTINNSFELEIGRNVGGQIKFGEEGRTFTLGGPGGIALSTSGGALTADLTGHLIELEGDYLYARIRMLSRGTYYKDSLWSAYAGFSHQIKLVISGLKVSITPDLPADLTSQEFNVKRLELTGFVRGADMFTIDIKPSSGTEWQSFTYFMYAGAIDVSGVILQPGEYDVRFTALNNGEYYLGGNTETVKIEVWFMHAEPTNVTHTVKYAMGATQAEDEYNPTSVIVNFGNAIINKTYNIRLLDPLSLTELHISGIIYGVGGFEIIDILNQLPPRSYIISVSAPASGYFLESKQVFSSSGSGVYKHQYRMPQAEEAALTHIMEYDAPEPYTGFVRAHGYIYFTHSSQLPGHGLPFDAFNGESYVPVYAGYNVWVRDNKGNSANYNCFVGKNESGFFIKSGADGFTINPLTGEIRFDISVFAYSTGRINNPYISGYYYYTITTLVPGEFTSNMDVRASPPLYQDYSMGGRMFNFLIKYPYRPEELTLMNGETIGKNTWLYWTLAGPEAAAGNVRFVVSINGKEHLINLIGAPTSAPGIYSYSLFSIDGLIMDYLRGGDNRIRVAVEAMPDKHFSRGDWSDEIPVNGYQVVLPAPNVNWGSNNVVSWNNQLNSNWDNIDTVWYEVIVAYDTDSTAEKNGSGYEDIHTWTMPRSPNPEMSFNLYDMLWGTDYLNGLSLKNGAYRLTIKIISSNSAYTPSEAAVWRQFKDPFAMPADVAVVVTVNGSTLLADDKEAYTSNETETKINVSWLRVEMEMSDSTKVYPKKYMIQVFLSVGTNSEIIKGEYEICLDTNDERLTYDSVTNKYTYDIWADFKNQRGGGDYVVYVIAIGESSDLFSSSPRSNKTPAAQFKHYVKLPVPQLPATLSLDFTGEGWSISWNAYEADGVLGYELSVVEINGFALEEHKIRITTTSNRHFASSNNTSGGNFYLDQGAWNTVRLRAIGNPDFYVNSDYSQVVYYNLPKAFPPRDFAVLTNQPGRVEVNETTVRAQTAEVTLTWSFLNQNDAEHYMLLVMDESGISHCNTLYFCVDRESLRRNIYLCNSEGKRIDFAGTLGGNALLGSLDGDLTGSFVINIPAWVLFGDYEQSTGPGRYKILLSGYNPNLQELGVYGPSPFQFIYRIRLDSPVVEIVTNLGPGLDYITAQQVHERSFEFTVNVSNMSHNAKSFTLTLEVYNNNNGWVPLPNGATTIVEIKRGEEDGKCSVVISKESYSGLFDQLMLYAPATFRVVVQAKAEDTLYTDSYQRTESQQINRQMVAPTFELLIDDIFERSNLKSGEIDDKNRLTNLNTNGTACDLYVKDDNEGRQGSEYDAIGQYQLVGRLNGVGSWSDIGDPILGGNFKNPAANEGTYTIAGLGSIYQMLRTWLWEKHSQTGGGIVELALIAVPDALSGWKNSPMPEGDLNAKTQTIAFYVRSGVVDTVSVDDLRADIDYSNTGPNMKHTTYDAYIPTTIRLNWNVHESNSTNYRVTVAPFNRKDKTPNMPWGESGFSMPQAGVKTIGGLGGTGLQSNQNIASGFNNNFNYSNFDVYHGGVGYNASKEAGGVGWWEVYVEAIKPNDGGEFMGAGYPSEAYQFRIMLKLRSTQIDDPNKQGLSISAGAVNGVVPGQNYIFDETKRVNINSLTSPSVYYLVKAHDLQTINPDTAKRMGPLLKVDRFRVETNVGTNGSIGVSSLFADDVEGGSYGYSVTALDPSGGIVFFDSNPVAVAAGHEYAYNHVARINYTNRTTGGVIYNYNTGEQAYGNNNGIYNSVIAEVKTVLTTTPPNNRLDITYNNHPFATHYATYYVQAIGETSSAWVRATQLEGSSAAPGQSTAIPTDRPANFTRNFNFAPAFFGVNVDKNINDTSANIANYLAGWVSSNTFGGYLQPGEGMFVVVAWNALKSNEVFIDKRHANFITYNYNFEDKQNTSTGQNTSFTVGHNAYSSSSSHCEYMSMSPKNYWVTPANLSFAPSNALPQLEPKLYIEAVKFNVRNFTQADLNAPNLQTKRGNGQAGGNAGKITEFSWRSIPGAIGYSIEMTETSGLGYDIFKYSTPNGAISNVFNGTTGDRLVLQESIRCILGSEALSKLTSLAKYPSKDKADGKDSDTARVRIESHIRAGTGQYFITAAVEDIWLIGYQRLYFTRLDWFSQNGNLVPFFGYDPLFWCNFYWDPVIVGNPNMSAWVRIEANITTAQSSGKLYSREYRETSSYTSVSGLNRGGLRLQESAWSAGANMRNMKLIWSLIDNSGIYGSYTGEEKKTTHG